jgi:glycosyltransferase involved in cell wall biosynthesis
MVDPKTDRESIKCLAEDYPESHFVRHSIVRAAWNMLKNIFSKRPFQVAYYHNPAVKRKIAELQELHDFDIVYCHLIRMVPYAEDIKNAKVILDYTDCISLEYSRRLDHLKGFSKIFFRSEVKRTVAYERKVADLFAENWIISEIDKQSLGLNDHPGSIIMPNQVLIPKTRAKHDFGGRLIFTGNMSVPHNVVAAQNVSEKIMPALLRKHPDLEFRIVGAQPSAEVLALDGKNNTKVLGFVPDLYQELVESDIFIAPLYFSAGIQNKVLEAMACGIPVVTTENVAQSLDAHDEVEMMIAQDNNAFVQKTESLIQNIKVMEQIGKSGRSLIQKKYSSEAVINLIEERVTTLYKSKGENQL